MKITIQFSRSQNNCTLKLSRQIHFHGKTSKKTFITPLNTAHRAKITRANTCRRGHGLILKYATLTHSTRGLTKKQKIRLSLAPLFAFSDSPPCAFLSFSLHYFPGITFRLYTFHPQPRTRKIAKTSGFHRLISRAN